MSRSNRKSGNRSGPKSSGAEGQPRPKQAAPVEPNVAAPDAQNQKAAPPPARGAADGGIGLHDLETRFHSLVEQATGSLREQAEAFETMMQTAETAMREKSALAESNSSLTGRLEVLNQHCKELEISVQTGVEERTSLEGFKQQLEGRVNQLETQCQELENRAVTSEQEGQQLRSAKSTLEEQLGSLETEAGKLQQHLAEVSQHREVLEGEHKSLRQQMQELQQHFGQVEQRASDAEQHRDQLQTLREQLEGQLAELQDKAQRFHSELQSVSAERAELLERKTELEERIGSLEHGARQSDARAAQAQQEREELVAAKTELEEQLNEQNNACRQLERSLASIVQEREQLSELKVALDERIENLEERLTEVTLQRDQLEHARNSLEARVADLEGRLEKTEKQRDSLRKTCQELDDNVKQLTGQCAQLEAKAEQAALEQKKLEAARRAMETCLKELTSGMATGEGGGSGVSPEQLVELEVAREEAAELRDQIKKLETVREQAVSLKERCQERESNLVHTEEMLDEAENRPPPGDGVALLLARRIESEVRNVDGMIESLAKPKIDQATHRELKTSVLSHVLNLEILQAMAAAIGGGGSAPRLDVFDLRKTVGDTLAEMGPALGARGITIKNQIDTSIPAQVSGDAERLRRLLYWSCEFVARQAGKGDLILTASIEREDEDEVIVRFSAGNDGTTLDPAQHDALIGRKPDIDIQNEIECFSRLAEQMGGTVWIEQVASSGFAVSFTSSYKCKKDNAGSRRTSDRILQEMLESSIGPIIDLSSTGMRVICQRPPKEKVEVDILDHGMQIRVTGYVVWKKKIDRRHHEV
ncbi:MAG: hypothetical protein ACYTGC_11025, partial [Planctomycetota bacterium]